MRSKRHSKPNQKVMSIEVAPPRGPQSCNTSNTAYHPPQNTIHAKMVYHSWRYAQLSGRYATTIFTREGLTIIRTVTSAPLSTGTALVNSLRTVEPGMCPFALWPTRRMLSVQQATDSVVVVSQVVKNFVGKQLPSRGCLPCGHAM